jgi:hypothetical protein
VRTVGEWWKTLPRRSASKKAMRRFSAIAVVALALLASGCVGVGSAKTAVQRSPELKDTALVVYFSRTVLGQPPTRQTYRIACADMGTGDASATFVCSRLTGSFWKRYFGVPSGPISWGPVQGTVTIRGTVNGERVTRSYYLFSQKFRDWMQILGRDPSGYAPKHGDSVGWRKIRPG